MLQNIDIVVFLTRARLKGGYVRRAETIAEFVGLEENRPLTNTLFKWRAFADNFEITGKSFVLRKIAKKIGVTDAEVQVELLNRKRVLDWMVERNISDYKEVAKIIAAYYTNPERVLESVASS